MTTRVVNIRSGEPFDVFIGRGSKWGNKYTHLPLKNTKAEYQVKSREESISCYAKDLECNKDLLSAIKLELKDKILGCYCHPLACHGDILAAIADDI